MAVVDYKEVENALKSRLRESSIIGYLRNAKKAFKFAFGTDTPKIEELKNKKAYKTIIDALGSDNYKTYNARKVALVSITHIFKHYDLPTDAFDNVYKNWVNMTNAESIKNTKNVEDINDFDFKYFRNRASSKHIPLPLNKLIVYLYTMMPPLRPAEWLNLPIKNDASKTNHLNLKTGVLYIYEHKTSNSGGEKIIKLPKNLLAKIRDYVKETKSEILIPLSYYEFQKRFKYLFGGKTPTFLRKAYITQNIGKMTAKQLADTAEIMGHQLGTQLTSYHKPMANDEDDDDE